MYQKENSLPTENARKLPDSSADDSESDVPQQKRKRPSTGGARKRPRVIESEDESSSAEDATEDEDNTVTGPESDDLSE